MTEARLHPIHLTTKEAALFSYLAARPHQTVSRAELLREVWGFQGRTPNSRAPDFAVLRLRTKVERRPEEPRHVLTVHGVGYRFEPLRPDEQTTLLDRPLPMPEPRWLSPAADDDDDDAKDGPSAGATILPPVAPFRPEHMVGHHVERRLAEALLAQPGAPVVVFGPSGLGKSWLLRSLVGGALAEDRVVHLDLRHLDRSTLGDRDRFLWRVMADLAEGLSAEAEPSPGLDPARGLTRLLEREGLGMTHGRLLLVIDHAHEAAQLNDPSALYALLRAWCERTRPPWERLRLLLGLSSEPSHLLREPHLSPFNLAPPITLSELSADEVRALVGTYGLDTRTETVAALIALVGGHPALIRTACFRAATTGRALGEVIADALGPRGCYESALRHLQRVLGENAPLSRALAEVCAAPKGHCARRRRAPLGGRWAHLSSGARLGAEERPGAGLGEPGLSGGFQVGGAVRPGALYLTRAADQEALTALLAGDEEATLALGRSAPAPRRGGDPSAQLKRLMDHLNTQGPWALLVDELDSLISCPGAAELLLGALRAAWDHQARDGAARGMRLGLFGVLAPFELGLDPHRTPFNITRSDRADGPRLGAREQPRLGRRHPAHRAGDAERPDPSLAPRGRAHPLARPR